MAQARDEAGNIWEVDAQGNPVALVQPAGAAPAGQVFTLPESPKQIADRARQAAADRRQAERDARTDADRQADNAREDRKLAMQEAKANKPAAATDAKGAARRPKLDALVQQIRRVEDLYARNLAPEAMGVLSSLGEYLPTQTNKQFDAAAAGLAEQGMAAFRVPGVGAQSDTELRQFVEANKPSASNYDTVIEEKLRQLKVRVDADRQALGMDPVNWSAPDGQQSEDELDKAAAFNDPSPDGLPPANQGGNAPTPWDGPNTANQRVATGDYRIVERPEIASLAYSLMRSKAGFATIQAALAKKNAPFTMSQFAKAKKRLDANPDINPFVSQTKEPVTGFQRAAGSGWGAAGIGAANTFTAGGLDEMVGGINSVVNGTNYVDERDKAEGAKQAAAALNPGSYMGGQVLGGLTGGLLGGMAVGSGTRAAAALSSLPGALGTGTAYGAASGALEDNDDRLTGALVGGGLGLAGGAFGRYAAAPIAERIGRLRGNAPKIAPGENALSGEVPGQVTANLQDAQRLGLPLALADTDPALRALAGTVSRKSVNARTLAEEVFDPRARGQADRAYDAIDTHLAPVTDIAARSNQWRQAAQTASAPHYAAMRAHSAPMDPQVNAMLDTPVGQAALRDARTIAANEGRNPNEMGFVELENGDVVFGENPSWETLDFVKRGIDQQLTPHRNQFTGNLDLEGNPQAQAIEGFRQRFVSTLDNLNGDYKNARAAYQGEIRNRDALQRGTKMMAPQVRPRDIPPVLQGFDERQLGEAQRGAATNMSDAVYNTQLSGNPYNRVYGTPAQQAKVGMLFPEGEADFRRVYDLEREMGKTTQEVLGGSPTAARLQADNQLGDMLGSGLEIGADLVSGGGASGLGAIINAGRRFAGDAMKVGVGKRGVANAERIAPTLFNTDPEVALDYLLDLGARKAAMAQRKQDYGSKGALLGALLSPALFPSN